MGELIEKLQTRRLQALIDKARALQPDLPLDFELMKDPGMIKSTLGGALISNYVRETLYYDPNRATEYIIAHELMHSILHRSKWPRMYGLYPEEDRLSKNIADTIDNILDQYIFDPILIEKGFKAKNENQAYIKELYKWPGEEPKDPGIILRNAFYILQGLFFENFYKKHVIKAVSKNHPEAYGLACQLSSLIDKQDRRDKFIVREAMKAILKHVNDWLSGKLNYEQNLQSRIGISPLVCIEELEHSAVKTIEFNSYLSQFQERPMWVGAYSTKTDNVRFLNLLVFGDDIEPDIIQKMSVDWQTLNLRDLFQAYALGKYALTDEAV